MLRGGAAAVAALAFASSVAVAAPNYAASPPPRSSGFYSALSMINGDFAIAGGYYNYGQAGFNGKSGTGEGLISLRFTVPAGGRWHEELEGQGLWLFDGGNNSFGAFSHTYAQGQSFAGGLLLGVSRLHSTGVFTVGAEAALSRPRATIVGLAAASFQPNAPDFLTIGVEGRFYPHPNLKVLGGIAWANYDADGDNAHDSDWLLYAGLEHRIPGTILSAFGSVAWVGSNTHIPNNIEAMGGIRVLFDDPNTTLQAHDQVVPFDAFRTIQARNILNF